MKLSIKFSIMFFSMILVLITIVSINAKSYLVNETNMIAKNATYNPLFSASSPNYEVNSNEELLYEVLKEVVITKQSDCDIKIQILSIDYINGLIDVNVIQTYTYFNGSTRTISNRKTIILEEEL